MPGRCEGARKTNARPLDRGRALRPWYHPGSPPSRDDGLASRCVLAHGYRDVARNNGGQTGDAYCAVSVGDARNLPRWNAESPAHAGAVGISARRSCSNGLSAPPSHQSRLAEPAGDRLLVLVIAMGPCAGEEEQKTTTKMWWWKFTSLILRDVLPPELAPGAKRWLPGFKGPIPSTTLDERRVRFSC